MALVPAESSAIESVKNAKPKKAIVSKLKRFDTPATTPQTEDWHIKAWESSKARVDEIASSVNRRASAYSAWLKSKNLNPDTDGSVELMKTFNNLNKADVISTSKDPVGNFYVPAAVRTL